MPETEALHKVDIFESETEGVILPPENSELGSKPKNLPAESIEAFYTFGEVRFSSQFFKCAYMYSVPVHMFNYYGNYIGSFLPANNDASGEVQILQYKSYINDSIRLYIAKSILEAAVRNILHNLKIQNYENNNLDDTINEISSYLELIHFADSVPELLGYEGSVRNIYYSVWNELIKSGGDFNKRIKQPPYGIVNSLISFGNSVLYGIILSEIYRTRLNPYVGFIHEAGDKKQPLVYDLSEIFKPVIVDRVIFRVLNLNIIGEKDFHKTPKGFYLKDPQRKKFVEEIENRLSTTIQHKRLNRKISYRSLIRMECYNLINYLKGNIKSYEPYRAG
jgi:CRISPR-associated protein Cas1